MIPRRLDRPFIEAWLRRTGRQLAVSGRISQLATILSGENGGSIDDWRSKLQDIMAGNDLPTMELLTRIDALLAMPAKKDPRPAVQQAMWF